MKTIVPTLIAACIAFCAAVSVAHTAEKPKPWAKKFTMSREECLRRKIQWRKEHGMVAPIGGGVGGGWSNMTNVHDHDSWVKPWVSKCADLYGRL